MSDARAETYTSQMDNPPSMALLALVDTGASITVILPHVVERLGLEQRGTCTIGGVSKKAEVYPNYDVSLAILTPDRREIFFRVGDMQAACIDLSSPGIDVLLGKDILENFQIGVNFREQWVTLDLLEDDVELEAAC